MPILRVLSTPLTSLGGLADLVAVTVSVTAVSSAYTSARVATATPRPFTADKDASDGVSPNPPH